jgi:predicted glycosyltransferase involved in capsule biosynthesis
MAKISVIVPFKTDNGPRAKAFVWLKKRYQTLFIKKFSDLEVCFNISSDESFCKPKIINEAVKGSHGEIIAIADADILYDPEILFQAANLLKKGSPWVIPYVRVLDLKPLATKRVLKFKPSIPVSVIHIKPSEVCSIRYGVGGLIVLLRKSFDEVGGFDERFKGWGREDSAFRHTMDAICGKYNRIKVDLYHLWHPKVGQKSPNLPDNDQIYKAYQSAIGNANLMKEIVAERLQVKTQQESQNADILADYP